MYYGNDGHDYDKDVEEVSHIGDMLKVWLLVIYRAWDEGAKVTKRICEYLPRDGKNLRLDVR